MGAGGGVDADGNSFFSVCFVQLLRGTNLIATDVSMHETLNLNFGEVCDAAFGASFCLC